MYDTKRSLFNSTNKQNINKFNNSKFKSNKKNILDLLTSDISTNILSIDYNINDQNTQNTDDKNININSQNINDINTNISDFSINNIGIQRDMQSGNYDQDVNTTDFDITNKDIDKSDHYDADQDINKSDDNIGLTDQDINKSDDNIEEIDQNNIKEQFNLDIHQNDNSDAISNDIEKLSKQNTENLEYVMKHSDNIQVMPLEPSSIDNIISLEEAQTEIHNDENILISNIDKILKNSQTDDTDVMINDTSSALNDFTNGINIKEIRINDTESSLNTSENKILNDEIKEILIDDIDEIPDETSAENILDKINKEKYYDKKDDYNDIIHKNDQTKPTINTENKNSNNNSSNNSSEDYYYVKFNNLKDDNKINKFIPKINDDDYINIKKKKKKFKNSKSIIPLDIDHNSIFIKKSKNKVTEKAEVINKSLYYLSDIDKILNFVIVDTDIAAIRSLNTNKGYPLIYGSIGKYIGKNNNRIPVVFDFNKAKFIGNKICSKAYKTGVLPSQFDINKPIFPIFGSIIISYKLKKKDNILFLGHISKNDYKKLSSPDALKYDLIYYIIDNCKRGIINPVGFDNIIVEKITLNKYEYLSSNNNGISFLDMLESTDDVRFNKKNIDLLKILYNNEEFIYNV